MTTRPGMNGERKLSELIRRELASESNRGFLARMPAFRPDAELPEELRVLLSQLDRAEACG